MVRMMDSMSSVMKAARTMTDEVKDASLVERLAARTMTAEMKDARLVEK